jgi:hypothetical protein
MFKDAYAKARGYTRPVVISTRTISGKCRSEAATYVVLNREGWIVTAYHVLGACVALAKAVGEIQRDLPPSQR